MGGFGHRGRRRLLGRGLVGRGLLVLFRMRRVLEDGRLTGRLLGLRPGLGLGRGVLGGWAGGSSRVRSTAPLLIVVNGRGCRRYAWWKP
ncbi:MULTISPECIES: hypothetical protein [Streptomyces]|nr:MULTISPECIES: hypothetical protein [Streptomyces]